MSERVSYATKIDSELRDKLAELSKVTYKKGSVFLP